MKIGRVVLTEFPIVANFPLHWGDQDAFGHVNNIVYLLWCETARVEYLIRVGLWPPLPPDGIAPILASIACDYRRPLTYPDTVHVGARVTRIGNSSFTMQQHIISETLGTLVAEVSSVLVVLDFSRNETVPVPGNVRKAIEQLEGRTLKSVPKKTRT